MTSRIRIYTQFEQEQVLRPIATVVVSDQREQACWLPERVTAEAQFFLVRVEAESKDVEQQIRSVLQRPFVTVLKSSMHITRAVRTRGDYSANEPYGTPIYWRAAIGRLKSEAGLIYDLQDYGQMLQEMEAYNLQNSEQILQQTGTVLSSAQGRLPAALRTLVSVWHDPRTVDDDRIELAVASYQWSGIAETFRWVEKDTLVVVGTYLMHHQRDLDWDVILQGGVRGYSLYLHEFVELMWYAERHFDPFDADMQSKHYPIAHSLGLLSEHRFLQVVAQAMGYNFSLRELILGNPRSDLPQRDWSDVWTHHQQELSIVDAAFNPNQASEMQGLYRHLGFQRVT